VDFDQVPDFSRCIVSGAFVDSLVLDFAVQDASLSIYANSFREELYDPTTLMGFWRNRHIMRDFGTGNWVLEDKQQLMDILRTIGYGAEMGQRMVVSPGG
jgi:Mitosis protein DIM1